MRHAAGQLADGLELLRLTKLELELLANRDVARDAVDADGRAGALDEAQAQLDLGLRSSWSPDVDDQLGGRAVAPQIGQRRSDGRLIGRRRRRPRA